MPKWLEISLEVEGELAESVAEVLRRFIPDGVVIESTAVASDPFDAEGRITGLLRVFGYLPVDDQLEVTRQRLEESLWYLSRIRPLPDLQTRLIENENWAEAWKQHYQPVAIGSRLMIVPAWMESPEAGRIPIRIDPGMAFGTGTHPSTQLCLEVLETVCLSITEGARSEMDVIDLGCGTAILAIAALKLGVRSVLGVDTDADAVGAARHNAKVNGVAERLELGQGSLAEIRAGVFSIRSAQIVLANILAPVLVRLLDEGLVELVAEDGCLVLSGILEDQSSEVIAAAERNGLQLQERRQIADWVTLVF